MTSTQIHQISPKVIVMPLMVFETALVTVLIVVTVVTHEIDVVEDVEDDE